MGSRHRDSAVDQGPVEAVDPLQGGFVYSRDDLGCVRQSPDRVTGVDALRAVAHEEIFACDQARPLFEHRHHEFLRRAGVRRRLQHHEGARADVPGQCARGALDEGKVWATFGQGRRHGDDGYIEPGARPALGGCVIPARIHCGLEILAVDVLDEGLADVEHLRPHLVGVIADDLIADVDASHRQREPDVSLPDDDDPGAIGSPWSSWHACIVAHRVASGGTPMGGFPCSPDARPGQFHSCGSGSVLPPKNIDVLAAARRDWRQHDGVGGDPGTPTSLARGTGIDSRCRARNRTWSAASWAERHCSRSARRQRLPSCSSKSMCANGTRAGSPTAFNECGRP